MDFISYFEMGMMFYTGLILVLSMLFKEKNDNSIFIIVMMWMCGIFFNSFICNSLFQTESQKNVCFLIIFLISFIIIHYFAFTKVWRL